jgi:peptidase MA superfamily protein
MTPSLRAASVTLLAALLLATLVALFPATSVHAGTFEVGETRIESDDPTSVGFRLSLVSSAGLESARLNYKVLNPDGNVGGSGDAEFAPTSTTDVTFELETITAERYIPVGSEFVIEWELTDKDGATFITEEERFTFLDARYDWQTRTEGNVTVYWYSGNESAADTAFVAASSAIADAEALLQVQVPYQVKVIVWRSEAEGNLAMRPRGGTFDQQILTGGQRVAPDLLFVFEPNVDVVRHEAAHIVTKVAGDGPFTRIPSWLDEGTAVYMQTSVGRGYSNAVSLAVQTNTPLNLRSLGGQPNDPGQINLFYGQSGSTVSFLIDEFGEQAFADLYATARAGSTTDDALLTVYGFDTNGLYNLWREDNGLPTLDFAPTVEGTAAPVAEGTRAPLAIPTSIGTAPPSGTDATSNATAGSGGISDQPTATSDESDGGGSSAGLIVAAVTALIVLPLLGAAVALFRKRPSDA